MDRIELDVKQQCVDVRASTTSEGVVVFRIRKARTWYRDLVPRAENKALRGDDANHETCDCGSSP
jgi:hypothetical protein